MQQQRTAAGVEHWRWLKKCSKYVNVTPKVTIKVTPKVSPIVQVDLQQQK
jgi:hypothetical protein